MQLARTHRTVLRMRMQARVDHAAVEAHGLLGCLQWDGVLSCAGCAEVVGDTADRDHQRIVRNRATWRDRTALIVERRGQMDALGGAIEADHFAETEHVVVLRGVGEVVQLLLARIQAARGDGMQQRLPQVRACAVDHRDVDRSVWP